MERSAGIILFRIRNREREYLILQYSYKSDYWGFSKGIIEKNETAKQAALREAEEETELTKIKLISDFQEKTSYFFVREGKKIFKEVTWFLGEAKDEKEGNVSWEHTALQWFSYEAALQKIKFKKDRSLLEKAQKFLSQANQYQQ